MQLPRSFAWILSVGMIVFASIASGQDYPNKTIRIVTGSVGSGNDVTARLIAPELAASLGQQVIVDNRPGSGIIPGEIVAKALPDGYTVLSASGSLWIGPFLQRNVPYDPVRDFSPITGATASPKIIFVHPSLPIKSVKELIALAKARPGELNYASSSIGGAGHLATELFKAMAGVNFVRIAYKSSSIETASLLAGEVQLTFGTPASLIQYIKPGKLRALAVTSAQPSALFPGMPTVAASGLPGYESVAILGIFSPAKTPANIISRLNQEIVRVLNQPEMKEKFFNAGSEVVGSTPEQFAATIRSEMTQLGKLIRDAGIRAE